MLLIDCSVISQTDSGGCDCWSLLWCWEGLHLNRLVKGPWRIHVFTPKTKETGRFPIVIIVFQRQVFSLLHVVSLLSVFHSWPHPDDQSLVDNFKPLSFSVDIADYTALLNQTWLFDTVDRLDSWWTETGKCNTEFFHAGSKLNSLRVKCFCEHTFHSECTLSPSHLNRLTTRWMQIKPL